MKKELQLIWAQHDMSNHDALQMITQWIHAQIQYCEQQLAVQTKKTAVNMYTLKITELQRSLFECKQLLSTKNKKNNCNLNISLNVQPASGQSF